MPESSAMLRRILSATEQSVLMMSGQGDDPAAIDLRLKLAPGTTSEMLPRIRRKVEAAAAQQREEPAKRVRLGDERECACGVTFTVRSLSQRECPACRELNRSSRSVEEAALDVAGVSSEEEDTIHVDAGDGGSPVQGPPPSSPASTTKFDAEPEEPAVPDEPATDPPANGNGNGGGSAMKALVATAAARREAIVEKLREGPRSVKCLSVELGLPLERVREYLTQLEAAELAERAGENAYDWPGAPALGQRKGKASGVWRPWTGAGAPAEQVAKAARDAAAVAPAPEPEPASADGGDRREQYVELLFTLAAGYPEASHLFDRIEKLIEV